MNAKMKAKLKRIAGFTLVELVVVIAILGILAGVAVPAYNGYMVKTKDAAAAAELNAVLKAAHSANMTPYPISSVSVTKEEGSSDAILSVSPETLVTDDFKVNFVQLYSGVSEQQAKSLLMLFAAIPNFLSSIIFPPVYADSEDGGTEDPDTVRVGDDGEIILPKLGELMEESASYKNGITIEADNGEVSGFNYKTSTNEAGELIRTYEFTGANGEKLQIVAKEEDLTSALDSNFSTHMEVTTLTGEVNNVVAAATAVLGSNMQSLVEQMPGFSGYLESLDIDADKSTGEQLANALVLYVAHASSNMDAETVANAIMGSSGITMDDLSDMDSFIPTMALMYGLMTSYAYSDLGTTSTLQDNTTTVREAYNAMSANLKNSEGGLEALFGIFSTMQEMQSSSGFYDYCEGDAMTDLNGYISYMRLIDDNVGNLDIDSLLENGFADESLNEMLIQILG